MYQQSFEDAELKKCDEVKEEGKPDPLNQLVTTFCRGAMTERSGALQEDPLYMSYAEIAAKYVSVALIQQYNLQVCQTLETSTRRNFIVIGHQIIQFYLNVVLVTDEFRRFVSCRHSWLVGCNGCINYDQSDA